MGHNEMRIEESHHRTEGTSPYLCLCALLCCEGKAVNCHMLALSPLMDTLAWLSRSPRHLDSIQSRGIPLLNSLLQECSTCPRHAPSSLCVMYTDAYTCMHICIHTQIINDIYMYTYMHECMCICICHSKRFSIFIKNEEKRTYISASHMLSLRL